MNDNKYLFPVCEKEFIENVKVRFNNINEGFSRFNHFMLENKSEDEIIDYICKFYMDNGFNNFYIDLYLSRVVKNPDNISEDIIMSMLTTSEDKAMYDKIKNEYSSSTIYYKISAEALPFIIRLGTREMLFSTFYASKTNITVWSNYALKFPVFYL